VPARLRGARVCVVHVWQRDDQVVVELAEVAQLGGHDVGDFVRVLGP